MNSREIRTIREAAKRFMPSLLVEKIEEFPDTIRITLPDVKAGSLFYRMYFYIGKSKKGNKFRLLIPAESVGVSVISGNLARLQPLINTYGLILTENAVITENNTALPLEERIGNMTTVLMGIDGIRRLWSVDFK